MKKIILLSSMLFILCSSLIYSNDGGPLYVNITTVTNASCNGIDNGSILVTAGNGAGGYTYSWSPTGGTNPLATNLAPGSYTVTVTDGAMATATATAVVGVDFPVIITTDSMSDYFGYNVSCFGGNNGWVNTSASGGTIVLDSNTFDFTGGSQMFIVPVGITSVKIKAWGAQGGANWINNVNYGGYSYGELTVTPGETLYVYVGGQPTNITGGYNGGGNGEGAGQGGGGASDVRQGGTSYNERVIVAGGGGGAGYWSSIHVVGGIGGGLIGGNGYRDPDYASNPGGEGGTQSGSGVGTCVSFNNPAMAGGFGYGGSPSGCGCEGYGGGGGWYGGAGSGNCRGGGGGSSYIDGVTDSVTIGGVNIGHGKVVILFNSTETLSYLWSTGDTTEDVSNLSQGNYTLTVTSQSGCTDSVTYTLDQPTQLDPVFTNNHVSCFGETDGSISVSVSGGVSPYIYLWENSDTTTNINTLSSGTYSLSIEDANGCTHLDSTTITEPLALNLSATTVPESIGNDGSINLTVTGGTAPHNINWSNSAITEDINGLAGGSYTATVVDSNGCIDSITVLVASTFSISENEEGNFSLYPNPTNGAVYIKGDGSIEGDYALSVMDVRGRIIYSSQGTMKGQLIEIQTDGWGAGAYLIKLDIGSHHFVRRLVVE
jgi:hypothetical protein